MELTPAEVIRIKKLEMQDKFKSEDMSRKLVAGYSIEDIESMEEIKAPITILEPRIEDSPIEKLKKKKWSSQTS